MLEIKYRSVDELLPYANNSKTHDQEQVKKIAASIKEFGFTNPVLITETGTIIAGHGRVKASILSGLSEVPTITLEGLTEAQMKAYVIADNRLTEVGGEWDFDMLSAELEALKELDFDIDITGFDNGFILDEAETEYPELQDGDREPFQQMTFSLHDEQKSIVDDAILRARTNPLIDDGLNDNSNGNALAHICSEYLSYVS